MIYSADMLAALFALMAGFAASWIALDLARILGWREPAYEGLEAGPLRIGGEFLLTALTGPRLLLANGMRNWRDGHVSLRLFGVLCVIAAGWAVCVGVLVLQLAYASGYFLR